jgi:2-polyprenyl-3-methyl-5-hydroxy-6-metoxy-1,4-benzoquinol methylase
MGAVQDRILTCFESGEGTCYEEYPCFHQIMVEDSGQTVAAQLFDILLALIMGISERFENGIDVLDAGCGRGSALIALADRFPGKRFVGYDLCEEAIGHADRAARATDLRNIRFEVRDLTGCGEAARFDLITSFDAVHDQKDPQV